MAKFIISMIIYCSLFCTSNLAFAQIPEEVLTPYKKYDAAIKAGDYEKADKAAYSAWKTSERVLGSHKTTGDLALNYALLAPRVVNRKEHESRDRAFLRAIELGQYHQGDAADITLDRHLERLTYFNNTSIIKGSKFTKANKYIDFNDMENAIDQYQQRKSWHEAVMEGVRTSYYKSRENYKFAVQSGEKALSLFDGLASKDASPQKYQLILDLGRSYAKLGSHLKAGLTLQRNFHEIQNKDIPSKFIRQAETAWKLSWVEIYKAEKLENAYNQGLCKCIDFESSGGRPEPITRIPPIMPATAERSGEAVIIFDVEEDGSTDNIRVSSYSERKFSKVAVKAAQKFIYTPSTINTDYQKRLNIPARFIFTLRDENQEIIPARPLKVEIPITVNQDMISQENTIITSGSRIRIR